MLAGSRFFTIASQWGKRAAVWTIRIVLGGVFLAAGLSKIGDPLRMLASVYSYQIDLPDWLAGAVAHGLPWVEVLLGIWLLAGWRARVAAIFAAALMGGFFLLTAQAWWRELPIECGCLDLGAVHPALAVLATPGGAALRNLVLLGLCAALWKFSGPAQSPSNQQGPQKSQTSAVD
jgi:uncharacterized membrane protein YphA (DoxX/SURF4 family)